MFDWKGREKDKEKYIAGELIWGDDFGEDELQSWYDDEKEGYAENLTSECHGDEKYEYYNMIEKYLYRYLGERTYDNILVYGGGYANEVGGIIDKVNNITVLEPSDRFVRDKVFGKPASYMKPTVSGDMVFEDNAFDLVISIGALHHVPNVTHILDEFYRVTKRGGICLIREPITSMRVFNGERPKGLATKRERGLPLKAFKRVIKKSDFKQVKETLYGFGIIEVFHISPRIRYSRIVLAIDVLLCKIFKSNYVYHSNKKVKKLRPTSGCWVLKKE